MAMDEFSSIKYPKAKKEHSCDACSGIIKPGEKYLRQAGRGEDFYFIKLCSTCADLSERIFKDLHPDERIEMDEFHGYLDTPELKRFIKNQRNRGVSLQGPVDRLRRLIKQDINVLRKEVSMLHEDLLARQKTNNRANRIGDICNGVNVAILLAIVGLTVWFGVNPILIIIGATIGISIVIGQHQKHLFEVEFRAISERSHPYWDSVKQLAKLEDEFEQFTKLEFKPDNSFMNL